MGTRYKLYTGRYDCRHMEILVVQRYEYRPGMYLSITHRIHGTGIFAYIYQKKSTIHVGKYAIAPWMVWDKDPDVGNNATSSQYIRAGQVYVGVERTPEKIKAFWLFSVCFGISWFAKNSIE